MLDNNRDGKVDSAETSWLTLGKKKLQASDIACVGVLVEQRSVSK